MKTPAPENSSANIFAIISDIHGNIDAFEAVLADIKNWPVSGIFCLGDIVGYGPEPAACVQRAMEVCVVSVIGNHEAMLFFADRFPPEELGAVVGDPLSLAFRQLGAEQMSWLRSLPLQADMDPITLSHASLNEPGSFNYIDIPEEAEAHFAVQKTFVSFQGHTHVPAIWEEKAGEVRCFTPSENPVGLDAKNRYAVNVGSVGQPRDGDPRACYALYDYKNRLLVHRRVEYNINQAQARFKKAKLPAFNASRLKKGK